MNSIFQQLYMIPVWRKAILEIQPKEFAPDEENVLKPLKVEEILNLIFSWIFSFFFETSIFFIKIGYFLCSLSL